MEKYRNIEVLGEGSFGTVFLIQDQKGKKYALKKVQVDPFRTEEALLEIEVMSKFIHPNLVRVYESSQSNDDQRIEILMEYCEGGDLLTYFKRKNKSLTVEELQNIFRQIVKAFIAMNVKDVFHRDLKPENVLLKADQTVKIADFGCARMTNNDQNSKIDNFSLDKGTPIYSSPEQLQNLPYSVKCDIWSAGCLLYFLYYGIHPFMDTSVQKTLQKIKQMTQKKHIAFKKDTDPVIQAIIKKTLLYEDRERASWRELWLSRFFCKKCDDVGTFISYQWSVCNIANWIVKQFWKAKKGMEISSEKNQIFAYYMIKFQYSFIVTANEICKKNPEYLYLFENTAYRGFNPLEHKQMIKDIEKDLAPRQKFYFSIKDKLGKNSQKKVREKETERQCTFADLDNSIKSTYRLLKQVLPKLNNESDLKKSGASSLSTHLSGSHAQEDHSLVWLVMARWINFEFWFSYEKKPRIQDLLKECGRNVIKEISREIEKYRYGVVE